MQNMASLRGGTGSNGYAALSIALQHLDSSLWGLMVQPQQLQQQTKTICQCLAKPVQQQQHQQQHLQPQTCGEYSNWQHPSACAAMTDAADAGLSHLAAPATAGDVTYGLRHTGTGWRLSSASAYQTERSYCTTAAASAGLNGLCQHAARGLSEWQLSQIYVSSRICSRHVSNRAYATLPPSAGPHTYCSDPKLVNMLISKAWGPVQMLQLVKHHAADLDNIHLAAAFASIGRWCKFTAAAPPQHPSAVAPHKDAAAAAIQHTAAAASQRNAAAPPQHEVAAPAQHNDAAAAPQHTATAAAQFTALQELLQLLHALLQERMQDLSTRQLASIIHSCYYTDMPTCMRQLLPLFLQPGKLAAANPHDIANVLWAAAKPGVVLTQQQVDAAVDRLCEQLGDASCGPQAISNSVWAVAEMELQLPHTQLRQLLDALFKQLDIAEPLHISSSIWACAKFRYLPRQLVEMQPAQLQQFLARANFQDIASTAWGCAHLGYKDPQLMQLLLQRAVDLLEITDRDSNLGLNTSHQGRSSRRGSSSAGSRSTTSSAGLVTSQGLCMLAWSVAILDQQQLAPEALQMVRACSSSSRWRSVPIEGWQQLFQVHWWLKDCKLPKSRGQGSEAGLRGILTKQQLRQCTVRWHKHLSQRAAASASPMQREVHAALLHFPEGTWSHPPALQSRKADGMVRKGVAIRMHAIDIAAVTASGRKVAIEVDGPYHYVSVSHKEDGSEVYGLTGPTQYRNRALAARGYAVISIPYWEWNRVQSSGEPTEQQLQYLRGKLGYLLGS